MPRQWQTNYMMCLRKKRFREGRARSAADAINKNEGRDVVHAYECPRCGKWHVGNACSKHNEEKVNRC